MDNSNLNQTIDFIGNIDKLFKHKNSDESLDIESIETNSFNYSSFLNTRAYLNSENNKYKLLISMSNKCNYACIKKENIIKVEGLSKSEEICLKKCHDYYYKSVKQLMNILYN